MTGFRVDRVHFDAAALQFWADTDKRHRNWPVVYALNDALHIYVGESLNAASRLGQHLENETKQDLETAWVVINERFNKSACLDLESYLIRLFAGDGRFQVLNGNAGVTDADYYGRDDYRDEFRAIFDKLMAEGLFTRSIPEIENSDLFKLSPFKALQPDQKAAVLDILEGLFDDIAAEQPSTIAIQGDPGTGKTIVAIYLMKLLRDIATFTPEQELHDESLFTDFFQPGHPELIRDFRIALVVPQQSLRKSIQRVFESTPGLSKDMVITPFDVGDSTEKYDLLIVDEAHRLNQRASQAAGMHNTKYAEITRKLFGHDDLQRTQLDWIRAQSQHQIFLADPRQSVRPADLPRKALEDFLSDARSRGRFYRLSSQMRVKAGDDYVSYVRQVLSPHPPEPKHFEGYDLQFFDNLRTMRDELMRRESDAGLSRLVAGFAWKWRSKGAANAHLADIEIDGLSLQWNKTATDWVNSAGSAHEVGSIHTIQGYDLNYAGVIIGSDLRYDPVRKRLVFDRKNYFDTRGKTNNKMLGITYSDDDLLEYVQNIYGVLLTRGILGTYVYVCDPPLREYLRHFFATGGADA